MNRKLAYLLLICFSLSILGLAFHHHADGVSHDNCPICSYVSHHSIFNPSGLLLKFHYCLKCFVHLHRKYAQQLIPVLSSLFKSSPSCIKDKTRIQFSMCTGPCDVILSLFVLLVDA